MAPHYKGIQDNYEVDYVISFRFTDSGYTILIFLQTLADDYKDKTEAAKSFEKLVQALARVGLSTEVRNGGNCSLLIFVKTATDERLNKAVYRSR